MKGEYPDRMLSAYTSTKSLAAMLMKLKNENRKDDLDWLLSHYSPE